MKEKKIAFTTLGCKVNMYDTEAMRELFLDRGYSEVSFDEVADVYLINTCSVTNFGDKKSRQTIRRARKLNPEAVVVASGCYAQVAPQALEAVEGINIITGTKDRGNIVDIVEGYSGSGVLNLVSDIGTALEFEPLSVTRLEGHTRAYLKIQEGCNRFCTYCIIPYARGRIRSRAADEVVAEVKKLASNGFKEVVLAGIHVASYGLDKKDGIYLADIIERVHEIDGIERIRFSSMEPLAVTDEFIARMKALPKVCDHYHLSLQSGSDATLHDMGRRYTSEQYYEAVERIKNAYPDGAITTDIIVGFPGESDEHFVESMAFAKRCRLAKIHVFPYSPKNGTPAAKRKDQIDAEVKAERAREMGELSDELQHSFMADMVGKTVPVLFEREVKKGEGIYEGLTTNYVRVLAKVDEDIHNRILEVKITAVNDGEAAVDGEIVK
jgi:threonylcarbamoyladenosine tRNA methylthiotransferase MtaB